MADIHHRRGLADAIVCFSENVKKQFEEARKLARSGKETRRVEQIILETDVEE